MEGMLGKMQGSHNAFRAWFYPLNMSTFYEITVYRKSAINDYSERQYVTQHLVGAANFIYSLPPSARVQFFLKRLVVDLIVVSIQVRDIPDAPPLHVTNGLVEFKNVNFSYRPE